MDWSSTTRLKMLLLIGVLLMSTHCLRGNPIAGVEGLHCVNDYLHTINCTMSITPTENGSDSNSSYWLTFTKSYQQSTFVCMLKKINEDYFCTVKTSDPPTDDEEDDLDTYADLETFKISFCHIQKDGSKICKLLDAKYRPSTNIKPNTPCCLTVNHNSSQHNFAWKSTYEEYAIFTNLVNNFMYQLHYFKRGDKRDRVTLRDINTYRTSFSVDDQLFVPDTEYSARVRSSPNLAAYKGEWSEWSSEVHWKTESAITDVPTNTFISEMGKVFIPICLMVPFLLLLCYAPVKKWRQSTFIPTPAPYFHTLYSDCQGDFKSWVITHEHTAHTLKESSVQIDTLTKCEFVPEEDHRPPVDQLIEGAAYRNLIEPVCGATLSNLSSASSAKALMSAAEDSLSQTLSFEPVSSAEGDSGCWLCSDTSLEKDSPWYCNDYCTLSAFQQTGAVTAEHHGRLSIKSCPQGIVRMDAIGEA